MANVPVPPVIDTKENFPLWQVVLNLRRRAAARLWALLKSKPDFAQALKELEEQMAEARKTDTFIDQKVQSLQQGNDNKQIQETSSMVDMAFDYYKSVLNELDELEKLN
jgi:hypothetical protein